MARCLIGCGSNQGARREQLDRAIELLGVMPGVRVAAVSRHRETRPVGGPPDQPPFLNGALVVDTELPPHELMALLAAVENTLHRDRQERWGPRTVDLDLLLYEDLVIDDGLPGTAALTVPHPRMTTRRFVLEPAVEIAPDLRHPTSGLSLRELLDNISQPHLHVCVAGVPGCGAAEVAEAIADATLARHVRCCLRIPPAGPAQGSAGEWNRAFDEASAPLRRESWPRDPHGTVSDAWLGALAAAAETALGPGEFARFSAHCAARGPAIAAPHVAIFLRLSAAGLAERVGMRATGRDSASDLLAGLDPAAGADGLGRLQSRLLARLRCRDRGTAIVAPASHVVVDADDLARAVDEAIAAVEAIA